MNTLRKTLVASGFRRAKIHLLMINMFVEVGLSEKELEVLANFISAPENLKQTYMFNTAVRKYVCQQSGICNKGISNHLKSMINKKFIVRDPITKLLSISPNLLPTNQIYHIEIKNETDAS